jgi:hypothetical protein
MNFLLHQTGSLEEINKFLLGVIQQPKDPASLCLKTLERGDVTLEVDLRHIFPSLNFFWLCYLVNTLHLFLSKYR